MILLLERRVSITRQFPLIICLPSLLKTPPLQKFIKERSKKFRKHKILFFSQNNFKVIQKKKENKNQRQQWTFDLNKVQRPVAARWKTLMMFGPRVVLRDPTRTTMMRGNLADACAAVSFVCAQKTQAKCTTSCVCVRVSCIEGRGGEVTAVELHELMQQHESGRATAMVTSKASQPQRRRVFQLNSTRQTTAAPATSDRVDRGRRQTSSIRHAGCHRRRLSLCSGVSAVCALVVSGLCSVAMGWREKGSGLALLWSLLTIYSLVTRLNIIWQRSASLSFKAAPCHFPILIPPPAAASFLFRVACFDGLQLLMHIHAKRLLHKRTAERLSPPLALALGCSWSWG